MIQYYYIIIDKKGQLSKLINLSPFDFLDCLGK